MPNQFMLAPVLLKKTRGPLERAMEQVDAAGSLSPVDRTTVRTYLARRKGRNGEIDPSAMEKALRMTRAGSGGVAKLRALNQPAPAPKPKPQPSRQPAPTLGLQRAMARIDAQYELTPEARTSVRTFLANRQTLDGTIPSGLLAEVFAKAQRGGLGLNELRNQNRQRPPRRKSIAEIEAGLTFDRKQLQETMAWANGGGAPVRLKDGGTIPLENALRIYKNKTGVDFESRLGQYALDDPMRYWSANGTIEPREQTMRRNNGRPYEARANKDRRVHGSKMVDKGHLFPTANLARLLFGYAVSKEDLEELERGWQAAAVREVERLPQSAAGGAIGTVAGLFDFFGMAGPGSKQGKVLTDISNVLRDPESEAGITIPKVGKISAQDIASAVGSAFLPGGIAARLGRLSSLSKAASPAARLIRGAAGTGVQVASNTGSNYRQAKDAGVDSVVARTRAIQAIPMEVLVSLGFGGGKGGRVLRTVKSALKEAGEEGAQQAISKYVETGKASAEGVLKNALLGAIVGGGGKGRPVDEVIRRSEGATSDSHVAGED